MSKKKKVRVELRKNRSKPARTKDWTREYQAHGFEDKATSSGERVRAKGDLSRKRTIIKEDSEAHAASESTEMPAADLSTCIPGRVLSLHGLNSVVETDDGRRYRCMVRRLLKSLTRDKRNIMACGDRVWIRPAPTPPSPDLGEGRVGEGFIERVEPRHGTLLRESRGQEHVLVANVDQVVIVMSLVEPQLKPHLIDRYLASAGQGGIAAVICLNKVDLVDAVEYQPLVGFYNQLGIPTFLTSAVTGVGIQALREVLRDRESVFSGQSGVGKSSLLNAVQPELGLQIREVSEATQKGKHTTTTAQLLKLEFGGWVVDTPGIRQFQLWDIRPEEVEGFFPEFRPYVPLCAFPDCTHTHEDRCAIKQAVQKRQISERRYTSYLGLFNGRIEE